MYLTREKNESEERSIYRMLILYFDKRILEK